MTNPHLKTGVDSTPGTLCEKHFRQWIPSNKFMLQDSLYCHLAANASVGLGSSQVSSSEYSAKMQVFDCKLRSEGSISAQRQIFHRKLRNQGCSFTRDE